MKGIRTFIGALVVCSVFPVCAFAIQDIIVLDPGGGIVRYSAVGKTPTLPGLPGYIRDDLLELPASTEERVICYDVPNEKKAVPVEAIRYIVRQAGSPRTYVEIRDKDITGSGATTGVSVWVQGVEITQTCTHNDSCWNTGVPDAMFGNLEPNSMYYLISGSWEPAGVGQKFQIQRRTATAPPTCNPF